MRSGGYCSTITITQLHVGILIECACAYTFSIILQCPPLCTTFAPFSNHQLTIVVAVCRRGVSGPRSTFEIDFHMDFVRDPGFYPESNHGLCGETSTRIEVSNQICAQPR